MTLTVICDMCKMIIATVNKDIITQEDIAMYQRDCSCNMCDCPAGNTAVKCTLNEDE